MVFATNKKRLAIHAKVTEKARAAAAKALRMLRALPVGSEVDAETLYGPGYGTVIHAAKNWPSRFAVAEGPEFSATITRIR